MRASISLPDDCQLVADSHRTTETRNTHTHTLTHTHTHVLHEATHRKKGHAKEQKPSAPHQHNLLCLFPSTTATQQFVSVFCFVFFQFHFNFQILWRRQKPNRLSSRGNRVEPVIHSIIIIIIIIVFIIVFIIIAINKVAAVAGHRPTAATTTTTTTTTTVADHQVEGLSVR